MRPCLIVGVLLLAPATLQGCGDEGAATARKGAEPARQGAAPGAAGRPSARLPGGRCRRRLGGFVSGMDALRDRLLAGIDYRSYVGAVREVRGVYRGVRVDRLPLGCLLAVGAPGESALNEYIEAANTWGDCLADASCAPESIEARLQRGWERASESLALAHRGLRRAEAR
jgi:hypothetical protein